MKKFILPIILACLLFVSPAASANFFPDIIVTSSDGIWTDTRAYATLNAAVTAVGANAREILIPSPQTVTALTIPATVTLKFIRDGAIANSGQLNVNTRNIKAGDRQIFTGAGDIDFVTGSTVRSTWFADLDEAIDVTSDDSLTLVISAADNVTGTVALGANITLKWESSNNVITSDGGVDFTNIKDIEAGDYQLFAGAGDFAGNQAIRD